MAIQCPIRRFTLGLAFCLISALFFGGVRPVLADMAPPEQPPGSAISPNGLTQVRMQSERIVLDVQPLLATPIAETGSQFDLAMQAQVSGRFTMRNLGTTEEQMQARFPLGDPRGNSDGYSHYPQVQNFAVQIDGMPRATTVISVTNPQGSDAPPVEWVAFDVAFPVDQDVIVDITYTITPTDLMPYGRFAYVLQTGAGWRDTIGSAEVIVRLPYEARFETVREPTAGAILAGNEVRWNFTNLEPTEQNDIFVSLLAPSVWQSIADAQKAVNTNPNQVAPLIQLANAYEAAVSYHGSYAQPNDPFIQLSEAPYKHALQIEPRSADLYGGYAQLLWSHLGYQALPDPNLNEPPIQRLLTVISTALALDPNQKQANDILTEMQSMTTAAIILPAAAVPTPVATAIPTPLPTTPPQPTIQPTVSTATLVPTITVFTATSVPVSTATPLPTPTNRGTGSGLLFGGIALIGFVLVSALVIGARRKH